MRQHVNQSLSVANNARYIGLRAVSVVFLFVLFAQSADLIHSHGTNGLDRQFDCDICLKIGSSQEAIPSSGAELFPRAATAAFRPDVETLAFIAVPTPRSRAPPQA